MGSGNFIFGEDKLHLKIHGRSGIEAGHFPQGNMGGAVGEKVAILSQRKRPDDFPLGHAFVRRGIWPEEINIVRGRGPNSGCDKGDDGN